MRWEKPYPAKESTARVKEFLNPDGIFSGMTKRLAISDGSFVDIGSMPKDTRKSGRLPNKNKD